jgi:uncharacterized protein YjdB
MKELHLKTRLGIAAAVLLCMLGIAIGGFGAATVKAAGQDDSYIGVKTEAKVYDDFQNDIWLQYEQKDLSVGGTADLYPWRLPQAITSMTNNDVERPTFHFTVISGDSISLSTAASTDKTVVSAVKPGTAVVQVTYDAFDHSAKKHFDACSVVNTAYAVFTVGETGTVTPAFTGLDGIRSYDTRYYLDGDTTALDFGISAQGAKSTKVTLNGLEVTPKEDGSYTAQLENRSNILGVTATDAAGNTKSTYRVIDARKIEMTVTNGTDATKGSVIEAGDKAEISFRGITLPVYKMASIYNPTWKSTEYETVGTSVVYSADQGIGTVKGTSSGQWNLADSNTIEVTPAQAGTVAFSGGYIETSWWGRDLGWDKTHTGKDSSTSGTNMPYHQDNFSAMPNFILTVQPQSHQVAVTEVAVSPTEATIAEGNSKQFTAAVKPDQATNKQVKWSMTYSAEGQTYAVTSSNSTYVTFDENTGLVTVNKVFPEAWSNVTLRATSVSDGTVYGEAKITSQAAAEPSKTADVIAAIDALKPAEKLYLSDEDDVIAAQDAYNTLSDSEKAEITNAAKLNADIAQMDKMKNSAVPFGFKTLDGANLVVTDTNTSTEFDEAIYKVMIPKGTSKVVCRVYDAFDVQNYDDSSDVLLKGSDVQGEIGTDHSLFIEDQNGKYYQVIFETEKEPEIKVSGITVNPAELTLKEGEKASVTAVVAPENVTNQDVLWASDDVSVATVDASGQVSAVKMGTTKIVCSAKDGSGVQGSCAVTVTSLAVEAVQKDIADAQKAIAANEGGVQAALDAVDAAYAKLDDAEKAVVAPAKAQLDQEAAALRADNQKAALADGTPVSVTLEKGEWPIDMRLVIEEDEGNSSADQALKLQVNAGKTHVKSLKIKMVIGTHEMTAEELSAFGILTINIPMDLTGYDTQTLAVCHILSADKAEDCEGVTYHSGVLSFQTRSLSPFVILAVKNTVTGDQISAATPGSSATVTNAATGITSDSSDVLIISLGLILAAAAVIGLAVRKKN